MVCTAGKRHRQGQSDRLAGASDGPKQAVLDRLTARIDADLVSLQDPETAQKVRRVFEAKGKLCRPPTAGETF